MSNHCTTGIEMRGRYEGVRSIRSVHFEVLPSLARPGLFGD